MLACFIYITPDKPAAVCRGILSSRKARDALVAVIREAGVEGGCEKSTGSLLNLVATKVRLNVSEAPKQTNVAFILAA